MQDSTHTIVHEETSTITRSTSGRFTFAYRVAYRVGQPCWIEVGFEAQRISIHPLVSYPSKMALEGVD